LDGISKLMPDEGQRGRPTRPIGYNVLKFDVPFLTERMHSLGLLTFESWERLNRELNWFDLYQFLGDRFGRFREWKVGLTSPSAKSLPDLSGLLAALAHLSPLFGEFVSPGSVDLPEETFSGEQDVLVEPFHVGERLLPSLREAS